MKPDRLVTLVERQGKPAGDWWYSVRVIHCKEVLALLRREQRAQRARVRKIIREHSHGIAHSFLNCDEINAYRLACEHILNSLHGRTP